MQKFEVVDSLQGLGFPEALRWRDGQLWFSDMFRGQVIAWSPGSTPRVVLSSDDGGPKMPGGLGWTSYGDLLVVDCLERKVLRVKPNGKPIIHLDLSSEANHPLNDMHVDPDGTAWIGGYGFDPEQQAPEPSSIFRFSEKGKLTKSKAIFTFPNGCERRDSELAVAETFGDRVSFFDDELNLRKSFNCKTGSGPDGLSFDKEGCLYVAMAFASRIERLNPAGGFDVVYELDNEPKDVGGPKGIFDCAINPTNGNLAFSSACLDESFSMANDTGSITLLSF